MYLVGDQLLVSPVTSTLALQWTVLVPRGCWTHVWSQTVFNLTATAAVTVSAAMGYPPVFYKTGSSVGEQFLENLRRDKLL